jgi:hypothetical protein
MLQLRALGMAALPSGRERFQALLNGSVLFCLHGLIDRIAKTQRCWLTTFGLKTALYSSRAHQRLLRPALAELHDPRTSESSALAISLAQSQNTWEACLTERIAA